MIGSTAGIYGKVFPALRSKGVAAVTVGPTAPASSSERTVVYFRPKPEATSGDASPSPSPSLADKDLSRDAVTVRYEAVDGKEARVVLASVAPASKVDAAGLKAATAAVVSRLRALKVTSAEFVVPALPGAPAAKVAAAIAQAAALSNYHFDRYLTTEDKVPTFLSSIHISTSALPSEDTAAVAAAVNWAATLADCTVFARDLVNERADEMAPDSLEVSVWEVLLCVRRALWPSPRCLTSPPLIMFAAPRTLAKPRCLTSPPSPSLLRAGRRDRRRRRDRRGPHRRQGRGPRDAGPPPHGRRRTGLPPRPPVH